MVTALATALDNHSGAVPASTARRLSDASSTGSTSASDLEPVIEEKTTRQAKDWRPKATLHLKIRNGDKLTFWEHLSRLAIMPDEYHKLQPADIDRGPIPTQSLLFDHVWILSWASPPFVLQQLSHWYFPEYKWPIALAYPLYVFFFANFLVQVVRRAGRLGLKYGMLDEKVSGGVGFCESPCC
jgi:hypothetical protein